MEVPQLVCVKALVTAVHAHDNRKGDCHFARRYGDDKNAEERTRGGVVRGKVGKADKVDVRGVEHELNRNEHANEVAPAHQTPHANAEQQKGEN
jgi:hypothetical protein